MHSKELHHQNSVRICCVSRASCEEITGNWRRLHNEEFEHLYPLPKNDKVKKYEMGRPRRTNAEKRNAWRVLVGEPKGNRSLGRPRHRWEDNDAP
jgi:CRISPR/Cas system-associated endoribonuclease Cas2